MILIKKYINNVIFLLIFFSIKNLYSQEIKVQIFDQNNIPLPYTNILNLNNNLGTISNENGYFNLDSNQHHEDDTIKFLHIGFKTYKITFNELKNIKNIILEENIINLSEIFIFQSEPKPLEIIQKILYNAEKNYKTKPIKQKVFIRNRNKGKTKKFNIDYKKSSINELGENFFDKIVKKVPEKWLDYSDILTEVYEANVGSDSVGLKINPIRVVELNDESLNGIEDLQKIFNEKLNSIDSTEYWKFKSGIFGVKIPKPEIENLKDDEIKVKDYSNLVKWKIKKIKLSNKKTWHFLYKPKNYQFSLIGGTKINNEDVYIIDFEALKKGKYNGRIYVSIKNYAIVKADFYMPKEKINKFNLLGVFMSANKKIISIYFEKLDSFYSLKYFAETQSYNFGIKRPISLIKKKENGLFDKKIDEIKVNINADFESSNSYEYFVQNIKTIKKGEFKSFIQKKTFKKINVNQFNKNLWKGFSIIEPTDYMNNYKKN